MYLLDTNVVSELRRRRPHGGVLAWLQSVPSRSLHVSTVTVGEIQAGIERTRESDAEKASQLESWLEQVVQSSQWIPMGTAEFRRWARLIHRRTRDLDDDAMIAATAHIHDLTVVTRNVRDFEHFGIRVLNPFDPSAPTG